MFLRNLIASVGLLICFLATLALDSGGFAASAQQKTSAELVERVRFDWTRSGKLSKFSLFRQDNAHGDPIGRLVIASEGVKSWSLSSQDDGEWASISEAGLSRLNVRNLVPASKHFLFVSANTTGGSIYLILKGKDSGCCVGSLTVVTPDKHGQPRVVFHSSSHLLKDVIAAEGDQSLELIGQPSDSEARALKNAQSYDPYRVYLLDHDMPARYNFFLSKTYTLAHYCEWHGPVYDERFVAVGPTTGAAHCRVMAESEFAAYRQKYPKMFPEP